MNYDLKPMTLNTMIGKAFNIYFDNFAPLVLISFVTKIPLILYQWIIISGAGISWLTGNSDIDSSYALIAPLMILGATLIAFFFAFIESGLIMKAVSKRFLNKPVVISQLIKETLPVILPLIGLTLLVGFITVAGSLLLIIPGIIFAVALSLSTMVLVVEGKGIIQSIKRSWDLSKGWRPRIFGYSLVMNLIIAIPVYVLQYTFQSAITGLLGSSSFIVLVFSSILTVLSEPISAAFSVLLYFNIRIQKEGFAVEHLTNEFSLADADDAAKPYL